MSNLIIEKLLSRTKRTDLPEFGPGDTIRVRFEGEPRRARAVRLEGQARLVYVGQLSEEATRGFSPAR